MWCMCVCVCVCVCAHTYVYEGIVLICSNRDVLREHYAKWNKSDRDILNDITCTWNLKDTAKYWSFNFSISQSVSSVDQSCPTLCDPMDSSTPGLPVHHQLSEFTQTHVHWVRDAIQPSRPLLSPSPPAFNLSQHQGRFHESALCIRWSEYWSFSFSISPSNEYSGLIFFRIDWLDLLAVQGTLKSLLQHHSSKASILQCSAFFHGPTLTYTLDHWKNHSFDQTDLCQLSNVSAF